MIEKLIDIFKVFLDKFLYKSLIAVFLVLTTIIFLPEENTFFAKLSAVEIRIFFFTLYFIALAILEFAIKKLWNVCVNAYEKSKKEKQENENRERLEKEEKEKHEKEITETLKRYEETKKEVKNIIVYMSANDKQILVDFIKSGNKPQEIEDRTYDGKLFSVKYNFVEVIKKYSKPIELSNRGTQKGVMYFDDLEEYYTQFKLTDVFYNMILDIYQNESQSYFEWE